MSSSSIWNWYFESKGKGRDIECYLEGWEDENIDFECIAFLYEGYTSSNLFDQCKKAAFLFSFRELLDEEKKGGEIVVSLL